MFAHHPTRELFGGCPGRRAERHQAKFVRGRVDFALRRESGGLAARLVARAGAPSVIRRSLYAGEKILYYGESLGGSPPGSSPGPARRRVAGPWATSRGNRRNYSKEMIVYSNILTPGEGVKGRREKREFRWGAQLKPARHMYDKIIEKL